MIVVLVFVIVAITRTGSRVCQVSISVSIGKELLELLGVLDLLADIGTVDSIAQGSRSSPS